MEVVKEKETKKVSSKKVSKDIKDSGSLKLKGWEALAFSDALSAFMSATSEKMPVKVAYAVHYSLKKLMPIASEIGKERQKLLEQFGAKISDNGVPSFSSKKKEEEANKAFVAIMDKEYLVEIRTIDMSDFENMTADFTKINGMGYLFDYLIRE